MTQVLELANEDFKATLINISEEESIMCAHTRSLSREMESIKNNQSEIIKLKSITFKMKNSLYGT